MDVLSDVLRAVRLTGAVFFDVEASAPWVAATPAAANIAASVMPEAEHVIMFHAVTSGGCWAELEDGSVPPVRLAAGDIVVMPMGDQHVLCSTPGMRAPADLNMYCSADRPSAAVSASAARGRRGAHALRLRLSRLRCAALQSRAAGPAAPPSCARRGGSRMHGAADPDGRRRDRDAPLGRRDRALQGGGAHVRGGGAPPYRDAAEGCRRLAVRACATRTSARRSPSCTAGRPRRGPWSAWRTRSACHAPCSPIASRISCRIRPCNT